MEDADYHLAECPNKGAFSEACWLNNRGSPLLVVTWTTSVGYHLIDEDSQMKTRRVTYSFLLGVLMVGMLGLCQIVSATPSKPKKDKKTTAAKPVTDEQLKLDAMLIEARMQQEAGNNEVAMKTYRAILKKDADYSAAHYGISQLMSKAGRVDSALYYAEKASEIDAENVWYKIWRSEIYKLTGQTAKLVSIWEELIKLRPNEVDYYFQLSNAYITERNLPKAIEALNRLEKVIGINEQGSLQKQRLWNALGKPEKGIKEVEALAQASAGDNLYNTILAETYMKQKNYSKAKQYYTAALAKEPNNQYLHISFAEYYKATGNQEAAFEELKKGFTGPQLETESKIQMLRSFYPGEEFYGSSKRYAFDLLEVIVQEADDPHQYALVYGDILLKQERFEEAAKQFALHLERDSSQYEVWETMMLCEGDIPSNRELVYQHACRCEAIFPFHTLPYVIQGQYLFEKGKYEEALQKLTQAERNGFNKGYLEAETYAILAECFHSLKNSEQCFHYYDLCLKLRPNDISVLNNYAFYLSEARLNLEKAEQMSARVLATEPNNPNYLDTYAWILHQMGRNKEALQYIKKAIQNNKSDKAIYEEHLKAIEEAMK